MYEPAGGSAPDIAGKGVANPIAQILSAALMLRYSLNQQDAANAIDTAIADVIAQGTVTGDIAQGSQSFSTEQVAQAIAQAIK
jgi:3-isopropylmalate dehydrogenase